MNSDIKLKIYSILFAALAGGSYWSGVRPSGYGSGPSMGLIWGLFWILLTYLYFKGNEFPTNSIYILLAFIIGFSLGGTQGYGQFNQWVQGLFHLDIQNDIFVPISPIYGSIHHFVCGLTWGGIPALFLSWVLRFECKGKDWIIRIFIGLSGFLFIQLLIYLFPQLFLPLYNEGYYFDLNTCIDCQRTIDTARNTWGYLGIFLSLSIYTILKDKQSLHIIFPISIGFALTFSIGGLLHLGSSSNLDYLPWWKFWEYTCGFGGGVTLFFTYWYIQKKGIIYEHIKRNDIPNHIALFWGFWIPLIIAVTELARDRTHQFGKIWKNIWSLDIINILTYVEVGIIIMGISFFLIKLIRFSINGRDINSLSIKNPIRMVLIIYISFFWYSQLSWIRGLDLITNIIPILNIISHLLSFFIFYKIIRLIKT